VLAATLVLALWDVWLWRLPWVQRIPIAGVPRSARGTWKGTLTSFWVDPATGTSPAPKTVFLVVRQTATLISVRLLTDESSSTSSLANISAIDGTCVLTYLYLNKPEMRVEHRSRIHHGSTVLDISGSPVRRLKGRYWTDRDSKGEIEFGERTKKLADDFVEAAAMF
jgi:SMODS-associating 2TM, beta-strand rich effector domain